MGDSNLNMLQPTLNQHNISSSDVSVGIYWDIENCLVLSDISPDDVAGNIRKALRGHPLIKGAVAMFSPYWEFNSFPWHLGEGCQRTDVPKGKKDAAKKAILVEMFLFARLPSTIYIINADFRGCNFCFSLHILGQRGIRSFLVLLLPCAILSLVGEGFVPPSEALMRTALMEDTAHISDNLDGQNKEHSHTMP